MRTRTATSIVLVSIVVSCSAEVPETPEKTDAIDVAVVVDAVAPDIPRADVDRVMERASSKLRELAGVGIHATEVRYGLGRISDSRDLVSRYLPTLKDHPPDGILVFTDDPMTRQHGGYADWILPPFPFESRHPSPNSNIGSDHIFLMNFEYAQIYARCGYDDAREHVSSVSIGGECRNRPGTPCVERPDGSWMCNDAVGEAYADHDEYVACGIVHELAHAYGFPETATYQGLDHWGSAGCKARTGMSDAEASDLARGEHFCAICPDVYDRIRSASPR